MRTHYLQHVPFEGLGSIEPWLHGVGSMLTCTRFYETAALPGMDEFDFLVIMGGPMSVNDEREYPWLAAEKAFVRTAIAAGKSVLGICLGAQLMASALGSRVYRNAQGEIGWFPVYGCPSPDSATFRFPPVVDVFHWHGETFDLPPGSVQLARNEACENQAFQIGRSAIGLQFHLEVTPSSVREMVRHGRHELAPSRTVQSEERLLAATPKDYAAINSLMGAVLATLTHQ